MDEGSPVNIIYLDFQKAFDIVPHQRLLLKLEAHGICDGMIDWIEKWLADRRQCFIVHGIMFKLEISFDSGNTRISIRTLLFLVYINYFEDNIRSNV